MTRRQVALLLGVLMALTLGLTMMSTASVPKIEEPVSQVIADPFCATSQPTMSLQQATLSKHDGDVTMTWTFQDALPASLITKVDMASTDFKYHWLVFAEIDGGRLTRISTLDTVSNQLVGYDVPGGSATGRIIGKQIEVTAPLPGAPENVSWYAAAALPVAGVNDLRTMPFESFCPAGWLAQYPPSA